MAPIIKDKAVSAYVFEVLGLNPGAQSNLLAIRVNGPVTDRVTMVAAGFKGVEQHRPPHVKTLVTELKFCFDDHDGVVYALTKNENRTNLLMKFVIGVDNTVLGVQKVGGIHRRIDSCKSFNDILVRLKVVSKRNSLDPEAYVPFHLNAEVVSLLVVDNLDLEVGDQSELIAAKGLNSDNAVKLVARVLKQNRGAEYIPLCKLVYDSGNSSVYVKVPSEADANLMAGRSFEVAGQLISFYRILSVSVRPADVDEYQGFSCRQIAP